MENTQSTREELAHIVADITACGSCADERRYCGQCLADTDAILAAGYRKVRTITTDEELDDLPEGTTIVDQSERLTLVRAGTEYLEWMDAYGNMCAVQLPATIIDWQESK